MRTGNWLLQAAEESAENNLGVDLYCGALRILQVGSRSHYDTLLLLFASPLINVRIYLSALS